MLLRLEAELDNGTVLTNEDYVQAFHDIQDQLSRGYKLVRFSAIGEAVRHDVDFTTLPENARPIHYVEREKSWDVETGEVLEDIYRQFFGYQCNDPDGANYKEIKEL